MAKSKRTADSTMPVAVILAAGESSRFWPLSTHGHKSLHRICGKAVIEHTIESLVGAGIMNIIIVQSPLPRAAHFPHRTVENQLGDGARYGAKVRYVDQAEPRGQGDAILKAAPLLKEGFLVVQPEHINAGQIVSEMAQKTDWTKIAAVAAAQKREETWLFGIFAHDKGKVSGFVEKPRAGEEPSELCNMGVYFLSQKYLDVLKQTPDGPLANVEALVELAQADNVQALEITQQFFPLKYPWHLFDMASYLLGTDESYIGDNVSLGDGVTVGPGCVIEQDCVIEDDVALTNCLIGSGSRVGSSLAECILGAAVEIAPEVTIEETHLDRGHVHVDVKGHTINTKLPQLGAVIGQGSVLASGTRVKPGVLIGAECHLETDRAVHHNIHDRSHLRV